MEELKVLEEEIKELLDMGETDEVLALLDDMMAEDVAENIDGLDLEDIIRVLRLFNKERAFLVYEEFNHYLQADLALLMTDKELSFVFEELYFDDKIDLLAELPEEKAEGIKSRVPFTERKLIDRFLAYPIDSAGSIMTIEFLVLTEDMTVREALDHIKAVGMTKETIYTCYVIEEKSELVGIVSLRDLVTSKLDERVGSIMITDPVKVNIEDDREEVAEVFSDYGFLSLPVVDSKNRLQGIVTVDDIMEVMEEETTEDFQKMAAISPHEGGYLDVSAGNLAKNRITWLLVFMITSTFTGSIIAGYEDMLAKVTVLSVYIPMLMSTGGNAGNQASATIIRGLATGEVMIGDIIKVFFKEFSIAIICSIVIAIVAFAKLLILDRVGMLIALTVSMTLIFTIILAKLVGSLLPIIAERLGLDPAIMAGPLITTLVDAGSLMLYFQFANAIIGLA